MTPNGHQSPFDTDDLREALHEDSSQPGFDGEKMLAFSRRARTRRRVGAVALTGTAAVTAVALAFGTGMFNRATTPEPAGTTALPPSHSQTSASPSPTTTSSRPASSPASTPASSAPPITTSRPSSSEPSSSSPSTGEKISQVCTDQGTQLTFKNGKNLLTAATADSRWVVVDERRVIFVYPEGEGEYLTLPQGQTAVEGWSDGTYTVIGSTTANSDDPGLTLHWFNPGQTGSAKKMLTAPDGASVQVRDGYALVNIFKPEEQSERRLYNLATGDFEKLSGGELASLTLLDDGQVLYGLPAANGLKILDKAGNVRKSPAGGQQYGPFGSNGATDLYRNQRSPNGDFVLAGPTFEGEVVVPGTKGEGTEGVTFGKNFVLVDDGPSGYHLIDLRTGGRVILPAPAGELRTRYKLNPNDQLTRLGDNPGQADLTKVTLNC